MELKKSPVVNGCNGSCCEKFTLPVTLNDLTRMKEELELSRNENRSSEKVLCDNGYKRYPCGESDLNKLIEMLVPLGITNIDPQSQLSFNEWWGTNGSENIKNVDGTWNKDALNNHFIIDENNVIHGYIFTCKHFDTNDRICTNYENRPQLCRSFGDNCHYKGCGFVNTIQALQEQEFIATAPKEQLSDYKGMQTK